MWYYKLKYIGLVLLPLHGPLHHCNVSRDIDRLFLDVINDYFKVQVTRKIKFVSKDRFRQFKYFRKVSPPYAKRFFQLR